MQLYVARLHRIPEDPKHAGLKIPNEVLSQAMIDPWSEVVLRVEGERIVIEAVHGDTDLMEMYAEELVADYQGALKQLEDG